MQRISWFVFCDDKPWHMDVPDAEVLAQMASLSSMGFDVSVSIVE